MFYLIITEVTVTVFYGDIEISANAAAAASSGWNRLKQKKTNSLLIPVKLTFRVVPQSLSSCYAHLCE